MSDSRLKESNIEWLGEIPKDWNLMPIKYGIKNSVSGDWGTDPLKKSNQKKCICLRVADFDFDKGIFKQNQYTIRAYSQEKINQLKLQSGDILIEKSGGGEKQPVGRAVLFDKDFSAMFANFLVRIRTNKLLVPSFLEYYLRALYYTGSTRLYFNQTTGIQNLKVGTLLSNEKIPNISIALQNNITNYLNKRCKKVDDIIAKVQQEITDLEEYRKSIITKAVTKGLNPNVPMKDSGIPWIGKMPENWKLEKIKFLCKKIERGTTPNYTDAPLTRVINQATFSKGFFDTKNIKYSTKNAQTSRGLVKKGDVLIASTGGGVLGKVFYFNQSGIYVADSHVTILRTNDKYKSKFAYYVLSVNYDLINGLMAQGSTNQIELQRNLLANFYFPVPNLKSQKEIIAFLDNKCSNIKEIINSKKQELTNLNQYKQSIIYEYVTGKKQVPTEEGVQE